MTDDRQRIEDLKWQRDEADRMLLLDLRSRVFVVETKLDDQEKVLDRVLTELGTLRLAIIGAALTFAGGAVAAAMIATGHLG